MEGGVAMVADQAVDARRFPKDEILALIKRKALLAPAEAKGNQ